MRTIHRTIHVQSYSRLALLVGSATRRGISHLVDFEGHEGEPVVCTCESFIMGGMRPCRHMLAVTIPMV